MSEGAGGGSFIGRLIRKLIFIAVIVGATTVILHKNHTDQWAWENSASYCEYLKGEWQKTKVNVGDLTADLGKRIKPWAEKAWAEGQTSYQALKEKYGKEGGGAAEPASTPAAAPTPGGTATAPAKPAEVPTYVRLKDEGGVEIREGLKAYQAALTTEGDSARDSMKSAKLHLEKAQDLFEQAQKVAPPEEKARFEEELQNIQKLLHAVVKNSSV